MIFLAFALLTLADFYMTRRRVKIFGASVEINPFKRFMCERGTAALLVSFFPELLVGALMCCGGYFSLMYMWTGGKFVVCYYQLLSLDFEDSLKDAIHPEISS